MPLRVLLALWSSWEQFFSRRQLINGIVEQATDKFGLHNITNRADLIRLEKQIHMRVALLYGDIDSRFEKAELFLKQWAAMKRPQPDSPGVYLYLLQYCTATIGFYEKLYLQEESGHFKKLTEQRTAPNNLVPSRSNVSELSNRRVELLAENSRKYLENAAQEAHVLALAEYDR